MITLDGSHGEGGGSILRQALALSIITGKEFTIKNIRAGRPNPGLQHQHLASLNAAAKISDATLWGNSLSSTEVYFKPKEFKSGKYKFVIETAGSSILLLQSILLPAIFSTKKTSFEVVGGTDVAWSPSFDYFKNVFLPQMRRFAKVESKLFARGYFPKGQGEIKIDVQGKLDLDDLHPSIILENKNMKLLQIKGVSHSSLDLEEDRVSERQKEGAELKLKKINTPVNIVTEYSNATSTGSGITLYALYGTDEMDFENPTILGASVLGEISKKAENVGQEVAQLILDEIEKNPGCDEHLCDQLIPYLAIAGGKIQTSKITEHTLSNIHLVEKFLDVKFEINNEEKIIQVARN